jgi:glucose 1-dehydrogenase
MLLDGRTIIVTGGNSGIGAAIAAAAAAEGANVVIDYVAREPAADALDDRITARGGEALPVEADVSRVEDLERLVAAAVQTYGRLDVMVNNAGIETRTSVLDTTEEDYDRVMAVNLKSAFFGTQVAARQFIAQGGGGVVINISSVHEDWPMPGNAPYCVSKGGMRMLTRNAGVELGEHGIRVVGIGPGAVDTPINAATKADADKLDALRAAIPLGRMASPQDIAATAVFLASDQAAYATATTVFLDGGIMQASLGL